MDACFLCFYQQIIGNSGRTVFQVNDAASAESLLCNCLLHNFIIVVGINADMMDPFLAKTYGSCQNTAGTLGRVPTVLWSFGWASAGRCWGDGTAGRPRASCAIFNVDPAKKSF